MATKSKGQRRKQMQAPDQPVAQPIQAITSQAQSTPAPAQAPARPPTQNVIRKGVYLSALVYVEGDMPAPQDFAGPATDTLRSALGDALKGDHNGLSMTLKKVEVQNNVDDGTDDVTSSKEAKGGGEKFQF